MKSVLLIFSILLCSTLSAQNHVSELVKNEFGKYGQPTVIKNLLTEDKSFFNSTTFDAVDAGTYFKFDKAMALKMMEENAPLLSLQIKIEGQDVILDLINSEATFVDAAFQTTDGKEYKRKDVDQIFYRGIIRGSEGKSIVALAINEKEISGFISNEKGNFVVGKLKNSSEHIIYNDANLKETSKFECSTDEMADHEEEERHSNRRETEDVILDKCVKVTYVTDYSMIADNTEGFGDDLQVLLYVTSLHNQVSTLYVNENIRTPLKSIIIYTSADPFTGTTKDLALTQFQTLLTINDDSNAYMLLSFDVNDGGKAATINGLCQSESQRKAVAGIYSIIYNVPTYSTSVQVVTHELGHLFGSQHTHACVWNGNNTAIDGCGPSAGYIEGSCSAGPIPSGSTKGTIMSYCNLVSGVGISFANGFGPQPGDRIRDKISNSSCLMVCECFEDYTITIPIVTDQVYRVAQTLTAQSSIYNEVDVLFQGNYIVLRNGFSVKANGESNFRASIFPCEEGTIYHRIATNGQADDADDELALASMDIVDSFSLTPNPASDLVTLRIAEGVKLITVTGIDGRIMFTQQFNDVSTQYDIDVKNYSDGIYIVSVVDVNGKIKTQKLVKN